MGTGSDRIRSEPVPPFEVRVRSARLARLPSRAGIRRGLFARLGLRALRLRRSRGSGRWRAGLTGRRWRSGRTGRRPGTPAVTPLASQLLRADLPRRTGQRSATLPSRTCEAGRALLAVEPRRRRPPPRVSNDPARIAGVAAPGRRTLGPAPARP